MFAELRDVRVDRGTVGRPVAASMLGVEKERRDQPVGKLPRILAAATSTQGLGEPFAPEIAHHIVRRVEQLESASQLVLGSRVAREYGEEIGR